jgi:8-oxo-dGTP pyrophosphatase MutT (NUDIX family)
MVRSFDDTTRRNIAELCAGFRRVPPDGAAPTLKRAAVAIALTRAEEGAGTAFLLTRRAASLRAHSAQWALPGGRCDPGETQAQAALRELHEELGVNLSEGDVLGLLDDYPTRSGYLITPVVVWVSTNAAVVPNPDEVESVHHISLEKIERDEAFSFTTIPESTRRVIRFRLDGQHIHAPTAALIYQFREVLAGRDTRVAELEQPVFAWK